MAVSVPKFSIGNSFFRSGSLPDGAMAMTFIPGTLVTLTNGASYSSLDLVGSCASTSEFQLIWNNDGDLIVLLDFFVGPGQYSFAPNLEALQVVAESGVQELFAQAINYEEAN